MHGDEPFYNVLLNGVRLCSPYARGWTGVNRILFRDFFVFPVCTGMNRMRRRPFKAWLCVPRMHGDEPGNRSALPSYLQCSPYARGWTVSNIHRLHWLQVFPVCTGMNRIEYSQVALIAGVPRMHGDEPVKWLFAMISEACSPYARGWTASSKTFWLYGWVFPVCTGMNRERDDQTHVHTSVPRMHGDEPNGLRTRQWTMRCSPYARGWIDHLVHFYYVLFSKYSKSYVVILSGQ